MLTSVTPERLFYSLRRSLPSNLLVSIFKRAPHWQLLLHMPLNGRLILHVPQHLRLVVTGIPLPYLTRRSFAKLELYRKFTNTLAVAVVLSVAWIGYELYFKATDPFGEHWRSAWIITAFWNSLAFVLLCIICVLWAPSHNATRYALSEEVGEDLDEEEVIALTGRNVKPTVDVLSKQDRKERKPINIDVFTLAESLEEDKRE